MSHCHVQCTYQSIRWINDLSSLYFQIVVSAHSLPSFPLGHNHPPSVRPKFPQWNGLVGGNGSPQLNRVVAVRHPSSLIEKNDPSVLRQCSGESLISFFNWHLNPSGANKAVLDQLADNPQTESWWFSLCGGNNKSNVVIFPAADEPLIVVNQRLSKDEKDLSTERQGYNSFTGKSSDAMPLVFWWWLQVTIVE